MDNDILFNEPSISAEPLRDFLSDCSRKFKEFCILDGALYIRLFDHLGNLKSIEELSREIGTDYVILKNICEILVNLGFIKKEGDSFKNTELSSLYLKSDSLLYQKEVLKNIKNGFELWRKLTNVLENGPIKVVEEDFFQDNLIHSLALEILCGELQKTVKIIAGFPEFEKAEKLLDLGGGHGLYSIAFARLNKNLRAYVFDFPNVIKETETYIKKFKAERVNVISGNLFKDDIGNEYDIILFSYNPGGKNPNLVPKIYSSLKKGGLFITKHAFYHRGEGSRDYLLDVEWNLSAFEGVHKGDKIYTFAKDLSYEDYLDLLERYFSIEKIVEGNEFGSYSYLSKFGDTLGSKIIIAKKKSW